MNCPECGGKTEVTHTRAFPDYTRRRRVCRECGEVLTTYETLKPPGERYPMGRTWTQRNERKPRKVTQIKPKQKQEARYCDFNPAVKCADGNRCAACGWSPIKKRREEHD